MFDTFEIDTLAWCVASSIANEYFLYTSISTAHNRLIFSTALRKKQFPQRKRHTKIKTKIRPKTIDHGRDRVRFGCVLTFERERAERSCEKERL